MRNLRKPGRCSYCKSPATVWLKYRGYISRQIRPLTGGSMVLYLAACGEHEGCVHWTSMLALKPEGEVIREKVAAASKEPAA
jgi:hypothetical protein